MPLIITTNRGCGDAECNPNCRNRDRSRRAVTTLEEAQNAVSEACAGKVTMLEQTGYALALPESGGTVGPLPDGTLIEVATATWFEIGSAIYGAHPATRIAWAVQHADQGQPDSQRWLLDAYNAREEAER